MAYRVHIESFEGPFDLLLSLVSRQKVDIGSISITDIIDQYLAEIERMKTLDLEVASEFLLVASTLLKIKAESLLEEGQGAQLDEDIAYLEPSEAREILVNRLLDYKKFKNAAAAMQALFEQEGRTHRRPFGPGAEFSGLMPDFLQGVSLGDVGMMAAAAFARREAFLLDAEHIAAKPIPVERYIKSIHARIKNVKQLRFSQLVDEKAPTPIIVVTFLAILELYKRAMIRMRQNELFGDIEISYIEGSGELILPDADKETVVTRR